MKKINEADVEVEERSSPKGVFALRRQHLSFALGGKKDGGLWAGGFPFDVELATLLPGKKNYPFHSHAAQWEHYIILSGSGKFLDDDREWHSITVGDHLICEPGKAHQIWNDGDEQLRYYVIADHHPADVTSYPETGKRQIKPEYKVIQYKEVDYYEDEE